MIQLRVLQGEIFPLLRRLRDKFLDLWAQTWGLYGRKSSEETGPISQLQKSKTIDNTLVDTTRDLPKKLTKSPELIHVQELSGLDTRGFGGVVNDCCRFVSVLAVVRIAPIHHFSLPTGSQGLEELSARLPSSLAARRSSHRGR